MLQCVAICCSVLQCVAVCYRCICISFPQYIYVQFFFLLSFPTQVYKHFREQSRLGSSYLSLPRFFSLSPPTNYFPFSSLLFSSPKCMSIFGSGHTWSLYPDVVPLPHRVCVLSSLHLFVEGERGVLCPDVVALLHQVLLCMC